MDPEDQINLTGRQCPSGDRGGQVKKKWNEPRNADKKREVRERHGIWTRFPLPFLPSKLNGTILILPSICEHVTLPVNDENGGKIAVHGSRARVSIRGKITLKKKRKYQYFST